MPKVQVKFTQVVTLDVPETKMKIGFCNKLSDELHKGLMEAYGSNFVPGTEAFAGIPILDHIGAVDVQIVTK